MVTVEDRVPIREAARLLGVSRTKVWAMVRDGELEAQVDPLDRRQRLISRSDIERLLRERGGQRSRPTSIGIIHDPAFQSVDAEEYMRRHRVRE